MAMPRLLLLNGCTSAGKSSLVRALQATMPGCWLRFGIDEAFAMLPDRLHNHRDGVWFDTDEWGDPRLNLGPSGLLALAAYRRAAVAVANAGANIIVDDVILDHTARDDWLSILPAQGAWLCAVRCVLDELCRREQARGDRRIGQARGQYRHVHHGIIYDFEVDTTTTAPEHCAGKIAAFLAAAPESRAVAAMRNVDPT